MAFIRLTNFSSIPRRRSSGTPLPRSTSVNHKSRRFRKKRTSSRTVPSSPERSDTLPLPSLPAVCARSATTQPSSRSVLLDSWLKRKPHGPRPKPRIVQRPNPTVTRWTSTWKEKMELRPPHPQPRTTRVAENPGSKTESQDQTDSSPVWQQENKILQPTNSESLPSENQTGWPKLPNPTGMYPLRDRNGCWPEREREERPSDDSREDGSEAIVAFAGFWNGLVWFFLLYQRFRFHGLDYRKGGKFGRGVYGYVCILCICIPRDVRLLRFIWFVRGSTLSLSWVIS